MFTYGAGRLYRVMVWGSHNDEFVLPQPAGFFPQDKNLLSVALLTRDTDVF